MKMIDRTISVGTIITIVTIVTTFFYTQGATATRIENIEEQSSDNVKKIKTNRTKVQDIEVKIARIESKIDEGFKNLERLLIEN